MARYDLQAVDDGRTVTGVDGLIARLNRASFGAPAVIGIHSTTPTTIGRGDTPNATAYVIEIEGDRLRNTEAAGIAYRAGYLSNTQTRAQTELNAGGASSRGAAAPAAAGTGDS